MKALFNLQHLYYLPQFLPVMLTLRDRGWAAIDVSLAQQVSPLESAIFRAECERFGFPVIQAPSEAERQTAIRQQKYDILFVGNKTDVSALRQPATKVVMIYHGIGLKQSYYTDISSGIDILTVESPARLSALDDLPGKKIVAGFTKLDPLAWESERAEPFLTLPHDIRFDPSLPTILYAPTFYPSSVEKILPVLAGFTLKANILVKLHQFSWSKRKYRHHIDLVKNAIKANRRIILLPESLYNILPAYHHSHLLVSDISSTLFEYLAIQKPIIQTDVFSPRLKHRLFPFLLQKRLDKQRFAAVDFVYRIHDYRTIETECELRLSGQDPLAGERKTAAREYLYRLDGKASERLVDELKSILSSV